MSSFLTLRVKVSGFVLSSNHHNPAPSSSSSSSSSSASSTDLIITTLTSHATVLQFKNEIYHMLGPSSVGRYLRLIFAGRLLAPDSAMLHEFQLVSISNSMETKTQNDPTVDWETNGIDLEKMEKEERKHSTTFVIHAILAPPGVRGGHQALLSQTNPVTSSDPTNLVPTARISYPRGIGIRPNGIVLSPTHQEDEDEDESEDGDEEEFQNVHRHENQDVQDSTILDLELGNPNRIPTTSTSSVIRNNEDNEGTGLQTRQGSRRRRRQRVRMGFDRLRMENGLSRDEVQALRIYFSRHIDQFIQQVQPLQQTQQHASRTSYMNVSNNVDNQQDPNHLNPSNQLVQGVHENMNHTHYNNVQANHNDRVDHHDPTYHNHAQDIHHHSTTEHTLNQPPIGTTTNDNNFEDDPAERLRLFRLRMEDAWMETQGPFSEFRLNLNTNNPLLYSGSTSRFRIHPYGGDGIFFRSNSGTPFAANTNNHDNNNTDHGLESTEDSVTVNNHTNIATGRIHRRSLSENNPASAFLRNSAGNTTVLWMGTERDFVWGFFLGYFVGFMMIFWVWLPTVPHKQKLGILAGLCCHLVLNLLHDANHVQEDNTGSVTSILEEISEGY